jgi:predicted kinase
MDSKTCWIFRGPPGSGKTTASKKMLDLMSTSTTVAGSYAYISLDAIREKKGYVNDWEQIKVNMRVDVAEMEKTFEHALLSKFEHVILDNVHSRKWEYEWAVGMAEKHGYVVHVIEVQADVFTCAKRQTHPVPAEQLLGIFDRWESEIKVPDVKDMAVKILKSMK